MHCVQDGRSPSAADTGCVPALQPHQSATASTFLRLLPSPCSDILEIGSDIECRVVSYLAKNTKANVVGLNPSPGFAKSSPWLSNFMSPPHVFRGDGRYLSFADKSFDAILSIATLEHVHGISEFLAEVARVLRPGGVFHTTFGPIWTCGIGHHTYAVVGNKEARFWKSGKNPVPNFAHLFMEPDEMREFLRSGPCSEELIEPIIDWIYYGDGINRLPFSHYMEAFETCPLEIQELRILNGPRPSMAELEKLSQKYGAHENFWCSGFVVTLRKSSPTHRALNRRSHGMALVRLVGRMISSPRARVKILRLAKKMMSSRVWSQMLYRLEAYLSNPDQ